jgi:pimeloyl-ACP methyl ester carboxylesterase
MTRSDRERPPTPGPGVRSLVSNETIVRANGVDLCVETFGDRADRASLSTERLGEIGTPTLVVHGAEDPVFPLGHALALAKEIPATQLLTLKQTGHELPPADWGVVVPAILRHTSAAPGTDHDPKEAPVQASD